MIATLAHMWTGFLATWPIWLFCGVLIAFALYSERTCGDYKRGQRDTYRAPADVQEWRAENWLDGEDAA